MVTEFADIQVKAGMEQEFIDGVRRCKPKFLAFPGCHEVSLQRMIEDPRRFMLIVQWDSVATHESFRASPDFGEWRKNVGHTFEKPPYMMHGEPAL